MKMLRMKWMVVGITLATGLLVAAVSQRTDDDIYFAIKKNLTIFGSLYEELAIGYVDPIDPERLIRRGLESMLETLDPYTVFIDEAANEDIDIATRGRYAGVGLTVAINEGAITVVNPIEGYSGFKQGVRAGDVIIEVDEHEVAGLSVADISEILRGDPGTSVHIVVSRVGSERPISFLLTREEVRLKNVTYSGRIDDTNIGYVKLERFSRGAYSEVYVAIRDLEEDGELDGLILDLRDNPGGLLEAAVDISGMFVDQGTEIVSTRGRLPQTHRAYRSRHAPIRVHGPLAILVNGNSASASEIVAGAMQDLDRGVIIGERTFGKGLVQIVRSLPYNTSLKMTTSKYYTPSGRSIQSITYTHRAEDGYAVEVPDSLQKAYETVGGRSVLAGGGIMPDVVVSRPEAGEFEEALIRNSAFFRFANHFAATRDSVVPDFVPSDTTLEEFAVWLRQDGFEFKGRAQWLLDELDEEAATTGYVIADQVAELRVLIAKEMAGDIERYGDILKEQLREQILARYHGETALIRASLRRDTQLQVAVAVVSDAEKVAGILSSRP